MQTCISYLKTILKAMLAEDAIRFIGQKRWLENCHA